jgi:hypothetical protein
MMQQQFYMMNYMFSKTKAEDLLYLKYHLTENQLKYYIHKLGLMNDPEVADAFSKFARMEDETHRLEGQ